MIDVLWVGLALSAVASGAIPATDQTDPCAELQRALERVPRVSLTRTAGPLESHWFGEPPADCQLDFQTTDSTLAGAPAPDFAAEPGMPMYGAGWRAVPDISADGAGTGVYGIERADVRCVVEWEQPSFIDDDGTFVQSDTFTMVVQCRSRVGG